MFLSILSLILSLFHNLYQMKIRKFFAFSSIAQIGYICCCLILNSIEGFLFGIILSIFYVLSLCALLLIFSLVFFIDSGFSLVHIREISSILQNTSLSFIIVISFLNFIGIPPLANFLFKFFILGLLSMYDYWFFFFCLFFFYFQFKVCFTIYVLLDFF